MSGRITWADGPHATERGSVNGLELFVINWREKRTGKDWTLRADLPGDIIRQSEFDTTDEAKAEAERVLVAYVEKLGARF